jgi:hypothetical protein
VESGAGGVKNMEALMSVLIVVGWAGAALQQWRGQIGVGDRSDLGHGLWPMVFHPRVSGH